MLGELTLVISAVAAGAAVFAGLRASREYVRQGRQHETELFLRMRRRLDERPLAEIAEAIDIVAAGSGHDLERARDKLATLGLREKRAYVGLFEEVAIFQERGQIDAELAHYMFGYYALLCADCEPFWSDNINRLSPYWSRFFRFVEEMRSEQESMLGGTGNSGADPVL